MKSESFAALRYRDFRLLWCGQLISMSGTQMQRVAIAWHVFLLTHDPLALGLIGLFRVMPIVGLSLIGGMVADGQDRRRVMLYTQSAMALAAVLLAGLTITGYASAPVIYTVVFLSAAAAAFDGPARQSMVPNLVPHKYVANAFSLNSIMGEIARVVGASVGGVIISATGGVGVVYALNALSFLATIAAVLLMKTTARGKVATRTLSLKALADGFRYMRGSPVIMGAMWMDFAATFFGSANSLLPIFATDVLHVGAEGYGVLAAAPSIGSILAGAIMSTRSQFRRPGMVMLYAVALYGAATIIFGLSTIFWLSLFFFALTGAGDTISMILRQTIRQLSTPDDLRGRMTSINMIFAMGGPQLGELEAGIVANLLGGPFAVVSGGIGCLLSVLLAARLAPALRHYNGEHLQAADSDLAVAAAGD
ncbi:MAG: MFS transporter [Chloroflexi bacterium]|nr:MFS transporter [Chloroflexota bacterium]